MEARKKHNDLRLAAATQRLMEAQAALKSPESAVMETLTSEIAVLNAELSEVQNQLLTKPSRFSLGAPDKKELKKRSDALEASASQPGAES